MLKDKQDETSIRLIFANQTEEDILLRPELDAFALDPRFEIHYVLSRPKSPKEWICGSTGRFDAVPPEHSCFSRLVLARLQSFRVSSLRIQVLSYHCGCHVSHKGICMKPYMLAPSLSRSSHQRHEDFRTDLTGGLLGQYADMELCPGFVRRCCARTSTPQPARPWRSCAALPACKTYPWCTLRSGVTRRKRSSSFEEQAGHPLSTSPR